MTDNSDSEERMAVYPWDPTRYVRVVDPVEARLSRGFLRCRAERWFPGFAAHWLPLAHSLGVEVRVVDVKPYLAVPPDAHNGFAFTVDDEPLGVYLDDASYNSLLEVVSPGASGVAMGVVCEYMMRRFVASLQASWSGPESSVVRYESELNPSEFKCLAAIRVAVEVNAQQCAFWVGLGRISVEKMDGLWRRQLRASARQVPAEGQSVHLEIAQLSVPPSMLADYVRSGTVVDLEMPISDSIVLKQGSQPWLPARLCQVGGNVSFEVMAGSVPAVGVAEGTTPLSIQFCSVALDATQLLEIAQPGAIWDTGIAIGDSVQMLVNGEKVCDGNLCSYEGRFAVAVA